MLSWLKDKILGNKEENKTLNNPNKSSRNITKNNGLNDINKLTDQKERIVQRINIYNNNTPNSKEKEIIKQLKDAMEEEDNHVMASTSDTDYDKLDDWYVLKEEVKDNEDEWEVVSVPSSDETTAKQTSIQPNHKKLP